MTFNATISSASVVLEPGEVISQGLDSHIPRLRIAGTVAALPVDYQTDPKIQLSFTLQDPNDSEALLPVVYKGLKPDMFAAGRDVIIDGEFKDGTIYASNLLTQCPSKYEPPKHTETKGSDYSSK